MAKRALCVGINDYPGTGSDLNGCVNDAKDWEGALRAREFEVTRLIDAEASRGAILNHLSELVSRTGPGDVAVFTYSGHGTWVPDVDNDESDGRDEAICPADGGIILDDDLYEVFRGAAVGARIVFLSDSCHSGSVAKMAPSLEPSRGKVRFLAPELVLRDQAQLARAFRVERRRAVSSSRPTALLISGCTDLELSWDAYFAGRPNGAFTHVALEALKSLPDTATYVQWHRAIRDRLPSQDYPQSPQLTATRAQREWRVFA